MSSTGCAGGQGATKATLLFPWPLRRSMPSAKLAQHFTFHFIGCESLRSQARELIGPDSPLNHAFLQRPQYDYRSFRKYLQTPIALPGYVRLDFLVYGVTQARRVPASFRSSEGE